MVDGQPGSPDLTKWQPNPRALEIGRGLWSQFLVKFHQDNGGSYYVNIRGCWDGARNGRELGIQQWKAWELYLATAKIEGRI